MSSIQDIKIIQKRKTKEMEDLVEIKLAKDKFEQQLMKIKNEISILENSIGAKKRKIEEEDRKNEEELDKELMAFAKEKMLKNGQQNKNKVIKLSEGKTEDVENGATKMPTMVMLRPELLLKEKAANQMEEEKEPVEKDAMATSEVPEQLQGLKKVVQSVPPSTAYQSQSIRVRIKGRKYFAA